MTHKHTFRQTLMAIAAVILVALSCYPFVSTIGYRSVALLLLLTISVLAMRMALVPVLIAAVLSALTWDYFFIPPQFTFQIGQTEDTLMMAMYFIVASLNGVINYRLRQLERVELEKNERENSLKLYNTLFSSLSHDLRTPIAAVLGAADTLKESQHQLSDQQKEVLLQEIVNGSLRLSDQVENLLNLSRIEAGRIQARKEWCDLSDLFYSVVQKTTHKSDSTHSINIELPPHLPLVQLDYGLTEQILHNLLMNALRHTPAGTQVTLGAQVTNDRHGLLTLNEQENDLKSIEKSTTHRLIITVKDNGPGFPATDLDRVFDKFYRPQNTQADGTGLGLFIVQGFTEAQAGEISLRNQARGGACFTLEFATPTLDQSIHHE
jgi:two-component system, OmpR family, sensor histidine kinase KdpD